MPTRSWTIKNFSSRKKFSGKKISNMEIIYANILFTLTIDLFTLIIYAKCMSEYREFLPCDPERPCRVAEKLGRAACFEDVHHEAYPRREYRTRLEKAFRESPAVKVLICRALHNEIHATEQPPEKPSAGEMREIIRRGNREEKV